MTHPESAKKWRVGTLTYTSGGLVLLFFWLLWGDFAWSMKERSVASVVQLLLKKFQASDMTNGLLIGSLPQLLYALVGPIISYKSDRHRGRYGRRIPFLLIPTPIVLLSMIGLAFSPELGRLMQTTFGFQSWDLNACILVVFGLCWVLFEFATIIANAVFGGLINDVVPANLLGRFFGLFRALSLIAGMIFNFLLLGKAEMHYKWIFIGIGLLYAVGFTLMCLKVKEGEYPPPEPLPKEEDKLGFLGGAKHYFRECFSQPYYLLMFGAITLAWMSFQPINLFNVFFAKSLNMEMSLLGRYIALSYMISLVLSYFLGMLADRFHPLRLGLIALLLYAVGAFWGGLNAINTSGFAVALVVHCVLSGAFMTVTASIGQRLLPKMKFAQYASSLAIITSLGVMLVGPVVGKFLDYTHHVYRYTYFISSGIAVAAFLTGLALYSAFLKRGGHTSYVAPEVYPSGK